MLDLSKSIRLLVLRVLFGGEFSLEANHLLVPVYPAHFFVFQSGFGMC